MEDRFAIPDVCLGVWLNAQKHSQGAKCASIHACLRQCKAPASSSDGRRPQLCKVILAAMAMDLEM